jgi:hypothetical protein
VTVRVQSVRFPREVQFPTPIFFFLFTWLLMLVPMPAAVLVWVQTRYAYAG